MSNLIKSFAEYKRNGWRIESIMDCINKSQSFTHLSDSIIRGWFIDRIEQRYFNKKRSSWRWKTITCSKCNGRGWFGHGRPPCPECVAIGKEPSRKFREWNNRKFTNFDKRRLIAILYERGLIKADKSFPNQVAALRYWDAFDRALRHKTEYPPSWLNDIAINGDYPEEEKIKNIKTLIERYKESIHYSLNNIQLTPKVEAGQPILGMHVPDTMFSRRRCLMRLALTFGCTCPITGEYRPREDISFIHPRGSRERTWHLSDLSRHVDPLGFVETIPFYWRHSGEYFITVSPFSRKGIQVIGRAASKCEKALNGEIDNEWVLAEVMQSAMFKRAA